MTITKDKLYPIELSKYYSILAEMKRKIKKVKKWNYALCKWEIILTRTMKNIIKYLQTIHDYSQKKTWYHWGQLRLCSDNTEDV